MSRFEPIHDAHAIEQVALVVSMSQGLADAEFNAACAAADRFKAELPGTQQLQFQTIALGAFGIPPAMGAFGGRVFTSSRKDGSIESELRVERHGIGFRTTAYTRWPLIWEQARRYFETLLPFYLAGAEIASISLNYVDKFFWDGDSLAMAPNLLLRPGSAFICPHVFEAKDLWHSHMGVFQRADQAIKRLLNINLDCLDENQPAPRRIVTITTILTDMLNQAGYAPLHRPDSGTEFFCMRANQLHEDNKTLLAEIINDRMCKRIGLTE